MAKAILPASTNVSLARTVIVIVVFVMSGAMHSLSVKLIGSSCDPWPFTWWYVLHALALLLEDCVQRLLKCLVPKKDTGKTRTGTGAQIAGYIWVYFFFWWSLPRLVFPNVDCTFDID